MLKNRLFKCIMVTYIIILVKVGLTLMPVCRSLPTLPPRPWSPQRVAPLARSREEKKSTDDDDMVGGEHQK